ncbi:MAG: hypothetical protein WCR08_08315 [Gammaproteobacteria bacterium]
MFYKYTHEMSVETAQQFAKISRANLVNTLIDAYKKISKMNKASETPELTCFLQDLLHQIEEINQGKNKTDNFTTQMQNRLENLEQHPSYNDISRIYFGCMSAIEKESLEVKDRDRLATQNKIAKIKNYAMYIASIPSIAVVAGAILMAFYPVGLIVLGAAAVTLVLSEIIFWAQKYQEYQKFNAAIKNMSLEADYAAGLAVKLAEIPVDPKQTKSSNSPTRTQHNTDENPVLISKEADAMLDNVMKLGTEFLDVGTEFVGDVTDALRTSTSNSIFSLWSTIQETVVPTAKSSTLATHLPNL